MNRREKKKELVEICTTVPSRFDLVSTVELDIINNITYSCPVGKSDHVWIEQLYIHTQRRDTRLETSADTSNKYG